MRKTAIPAALLLSTVLAIHFWSERSSPTQTADFQRVSTTVGTPHARRCAKEIINDWVPDDRIDGAYRRECYEAALAMMPEDGYGLEVRTAVGGARGLG